MTPMAASGLNKGAYQRQSHMLEQAGMVSFPPGVAVSTMGAVMLAKCLGTGYAK